MNNKNLLIGGAVVVGLLFLLLRKKPNNTTQEERSGGVGDAGLGGGGGGAISQENGGGAIMQTGQPILVAPNYSPSYQTPLPLDNVNNTLRPLPIGQTLFSPKPLFSKPSVSPISTLRPSNDVSANISQAVTNASNLRNFSTFNGMADGKVNGLDFGGDLD
jgi:hypothetical protein